MTHNPSMNFPSSSSDTYRGEITPIPAGPHPVFYFYVKFNIPAPLTATDAVAHVARTTNQLADGKYMNMDGTWWHNSDHSVVFSITALNPQVMLVNAMYGSRPIMHLEVVDIANSVHAILPTCTYDVLFEMEPLPSMPILTNQ